MYTIIYMLRLQLSYVKLSILLNKLFYVFAFHYFFNKYYKKIDKVTIFYSFIQYIITKYWYRKSSYSILDNRIPEVYQELKT